MIVDPNNPQDAVDAARKKRMYRIAGIVAVAVVAIAGAFVAYLVITKHPAKAACARLEELRAWDVLDHFIDRLESSVVSGRLGREKPVQIRGSDNPCREAFRTAEKVLTYGVFNRFVECIEKAPDKDAAFECVNSRF